MFNGVFSRDNLPKWKYGAYVKNPDDKKVKEHIGFLYLLTETQLCTFILLGFHIFHKKYWGKLKINPKINQR